jgi:cytochrome P450
MPPAVADLELPEFDYQDPALVGERFHEVMADLRARSWLARTSLGVVVLDREGGEVFLRSKAVAFPSMTIAEIFGIQGGALYEEMRDNIITLDGDQHRRLRSLVNPSFTPRAAERWRPVMREFIAGLAAPLLEAGGGDFVGEVARPYPAMTIAAVMGAPLEDADRLHHWSTVIQRQFDAIALIDGRAEIEAAVAELYEYLEELLAARREQPGDDLLSALLAAEDGGDRLSHPECVNLVLNVLVGGVDTTVAQLSQAIRVFAAHREQWEHLGARPELAGAAVAEIVRYEPITPFTARIVRQDMEFRDVTFPAGTVVLVAACTANREGAGGDRFDITAARDGGRVLTFGAGIHYCLGANLARAELEEALAYLAPRMPGLALAGEPEFDRITGIYGLRSLPVRFG